MTDGVADEKLDEYRNIASLLAVSRVLSKLSPDNVSMEYSDSKPSELAAGDLASQVRLFHELYPQLRETTTDDLNLAERAFAELQREGAVPNHPMAREHLERDIMVCAGVLETKGPFDIADIVDTTDQTNTAEVEADD